MVTSSLMGDPVVLSEGNAYTDEVCIQVVDRAAIDVSLLAGWEAMRQALIIGNIDDAVSHFKSDRRETYAKFFQLIPRDRMTSVIPRTDRMELVEVLDGKARYVVDIDIVKLMVSQQRPARISFSQQMKTDCGKSACFRSLSF